MWIVRLEYKSIDDFFFRYCCCWWRCCWANKRKFKMLTEQMLMIISAHAEHFESLTVRDYTIENQLKNSSVVCLGISIDQTPSKTIKSFISIRRSLTLFLFHCASVHSSSSQFQSQIGAICLYIVSLAVRVFVLLFRRSRRAVYHCSSALHAIRIDKMSWNSPQRDTAHIIPIFCYSQLNLFLFYFQLKFYIDLIHLRHQSLRKIFQKFIKRQIPLLQAILNQIPVAVVLSLLEWIKLPFSFNLFRVWKTQQIAFLLPM